MTRAVFEGHEDAVTAIAVLPDGRLASGSADKTVQVWNPDDPGGEIEVFDGHPGGITSMVALPDGRVASGRDGSTIQVWTPSPVDPVDSRPSGTSAEEQAED